jgi:hypothetical protein
MYHALCYLPHFIALSPTDHTLPHFLLLIALYGAFSRLLRFSPLIALYPALFRTLPFNPRSFAYCALSRFTPVIFALSRFNSLYVATLVLSRFSCFRPLCHLLTCFIVLYPALHALNCFSPLYFAYARRIPLSSLMLISPFFPPSLLHAHLSLFALLILLCSVMPNFPAFPNLCSTCPYFLSLCPTYSLFLILTLALSPSVCPITSSLLPRLYYIYIYHLAQNFPNIFQHLQNPMLISYVYA